MQSRFLAPEGRGAFVLAVLTVTIFSRLLGQLGVAVTSRLQERDVDPRGLVHRAFAVAVVLGGGSMLLIAGVAAASDALELEIAFVAAVALVPNVIWQTVSGVLLGVARIRLWNYIQLAPPVLTLIGMLVLVVGLDGGVGAAIAAWTAAHAVTAALALAGAREFWHPLRLRRLDRHARTLVRLALVMGAVQVVNLVSYRIELFLLEVFSSLAEVGIYSVAMQAAEALWLIAAAVATAITAPVVHESEERAAELAARAAGRGLLYTAAAALVVGVAAPFVMPLLFGDDFAPAARSLALLLPGVVLYAPVTILVVYLSVRRGRPRLSLAVALVALVVTATAALPLVPAYGGEGAAVASTIGYAVGGAAAWLLFTRVAGLRLTGRRRESPS